MKTIKLYSKLVMAALGFTILIISMYAIIKTVVGADNVIVSEIVEMIASLLFKSELFWVTATALSILFILLSRRSALKKGL